jgi:S1-C subfamily serine protease
MVQDALIWHGVYAGLKDGGWGNMTANGVREWRRQKGLRPSETFSVAELSLLFEGAIQARNAVGWSLGRDPNAGVWMGVPAGLLQPAKLRAGFDHFLTGTDYGGRDDRVYINVRRFVGDLNVARQTIMAAVDTLREMGGTLGYRLDRQERQVASVDIPGQGSAPGRSAYVRYDRVGNEWRGFVVIAKQNDPLVRNVIAATSAEFNPLGTPTVSGDGPTLTPILASLAARGVIAGGSTAPATATVAPPAMPLKPAPLPVAAAVVTPPPSARREVKGSGTAFVVRRDGTMLTNHHVVDGCGSLSLQSGEAVTIVAKDPGSDLAILRVQNRTFQQVARFRRDQTIDLGETVTAFGYPHYGSVSTALNITNGIVSATVGVGDDPVNFQINAAVQPGNSGGPVLDQSGLVIGIAVARLSDRRIMATTGTVPQNMNYAVRGQIAEAFLLSNGVVVDKVRGAGNTDLREVARTMQEAVLPVLCYR